MTVPTPAQVQANIKFRAQADKIKAEQDRRAKLRTMRVKTPLTRAELAAMALRRANGEN